LKDNCPVTVIAHFFRIVLKKELPMPRFDPRQPMPPGHGPFVVMPQPKKRRPRRRTRRAWIGVPVILVGSWWLLHGLQPALTWSEWVRKWHIKNTERFSMLAAGGCVLVVIALLVRIWRHK
jgi:hypothetical protein